jgi:hypothetical protein
MKRISIVVTIIVAVFILVNCQKEVIDTKDVVGNKQTVERTSRISFVKSGNVKADEKQQNFKILFVNKQSKTEIAFLVEYKTGNEYKLHDFDVAWNGKIDKDKDGKLWMNLNVYHKTYEKNAKNTMVDSAVVVIPDIEKFNADTISKLWLRFVNTSDTKNVLTLQYQKSESTDDNSTTTTKTSTDNDDGSGTEADNGSSETNVQDSTNTGSTTKTSTDDEDNSGSAGTDDNSSDKTSQDSTNMGSTAGNNDSNSGSTGTESAENNSGTTEQDSTTGGN